jgi:hypothetical protein
VNGTQSSLTPSTPPYGLSTPIFRFRALASLAGRAPLGGPREVALATYLVARLVDDCVPTRELPLDARAVRSSAARGWLSNVALPATVRAPLTRLAEVTGGGGEASDISTALASAITATSAYLDTAARLELDRLARALAK